MVKVALLYRVGLSYLVLLLNTWRMPLVNLTMARSFLVDIAYIPFVERFHVVLAELFKYDITEGRPKLATWIEELNKIDAYTQTKVDPQETVVTYKKRFLPKQ